MTTIVRVEASTKKVAPRPKRGQDNSKQDTAILVTVVQESNVVSEQLLRNSETREVEVGDVQSVSVRELAPDDPWWERNPEKTRQFNEQGKKLE